MLSRRPPEPPARPTRGHPGTTRRHAGASRRAALAVLVVGAAALLGACSTGKWTAPESTVDEPAPTTTVVAPVPGGGGTLTVTNPAAFHTESPGRKVRN